MTLKKLSAGAGYEYLTRQVAASDSTEFGASALDDYYSARGEAPGRWMGAGVTGLEGIEAGDVVTAGHMQHLFGAGEHPITGGVLGRTYRPDAVAGFDLTFSPVKSVSALWALATWEVAGEIEQAHYAAVADALGFLEGHGVFTREGTNGVRQVETRGLIAAAFSHRDSRSGDPDLHTHVAVANKVQTLQGKWLSLYGTVLHEHVVAASETYNTALEHHLTSRLGLRFTERFVGHGRRPVREVEAVDEALCGLWSSRRRDIVDRQAQLGSDFRERHGRAPTPVELIKLAQQANLETRDAKHEPRTYAEQRVTWKAEAEELLGRRRVDQMVRAALRPAPVQFGRPDAAWISDTADRVIGELESHRATWQTWHAYAEAQRQVRGADVPVGELPLLVEKVVRVVAARTVNLTPDLDPITEPAGLCTSDGKSVYRHSGADHFTTGRMLEAEARIVVAAGRTSELSLDPVDAELALMGAEVESGIRLNDGQRSLVQSMATDPRQVTLALAPAGSGKTTAMQLLAKVWQGPGRQVIGFAPSAAAAAVLRDSTGSETETLAKLDDLIAHGRPTGLRAGTMVIVDEAGMADTPMLDRIIHHCSEHGALVRLIGDDQQLAAVGAGGVLRDIATTHGAARLEEVVRFADPVEAQAGLDLRDGNPSALGFYLDHDRVHTGDTDTCLGDVLAAWTRESAQGRDCVMLAPTRDLVAQLNARARAERLAGASPHREVRLRDGNAASTGDTILTRRNDRRLRVTASDWVKNGDRWSITKVTSGGDLEVRHAGTGLRTTLPAGYVREHVELGYASTVHTAQGLTADVMHGIVTGNEDRQLLYTMLTRGRSENHLHVVLDEPVTAEAEAFLPGINEQLTAIETLDHIVANDGAAVSATTARSKAADPAGQLHQAAQRYADAVGLAAHRVLRADASGALEVAGSGPLPWLPGIPAALRGTGWHDYLVARAARVAELANDVRAHQTLPRRIAARVPEALREQVLLWRAANGVADGSVLGERPSDPGAERYARYLRRLLGDHQPASVRRWAGRIVAFVGENDDQVLELARELDRLERSGVDAVHLLRRAASQPCPEGHATDALAYRVKRLVTHYAGSSSPATRSAPVQGRGLGL